MHKIFDYGQMAPEDSKPQTPLQPSSTFRVVACIDMDAFYAQAEARRLGLDDSVPVVVIQWRNCLAVSYSARKYGILRMMTVQEIKKLCPHVVMVHVDMDKIGEPKIDPYERDLSTKHMIEHDKTKEIVNLEYFRQESEKVLKIFKKWCSVVEKASIDESFLDLTEEANNIYNANNYEQEWRAKFTGGDPFPPSTKEHSLLMIGTQLIDNIRKDVFQNLKYTCSAGISTNIMLAKLASGLNKPNDQTVIVPENVIETLKNIPIKKLRNFGGKVAEAFEGTQYKTLGDLQTLNLEEIEKIVKDKQYAKWVYFRCRGFDDEPVTEKDTLNKSISSSKNLDYEIPTLAAFKNVQDLIVADLWTRLTVFFDKSGLVPSTFNLHYFDRSAKAYKTKSVPIYMKVNKERFLEVLAAKAQEMVKQLANVLFPCKYLGVSVKNFQKNDVKSFEFDLISYVKGKQKQKEIEMEEQNKRKEANGLAEKMSNIFHDSGESFKHYGVDNVQLKEENNPDKEERKNDMIIEKAVVETVLCEKCECLIEKDKLADHLDFHAAQDLDKELNPNKRKYRKMENNQTAINFLTKEEEASKKGMENKTPESEKWTKPFNSFHKESKDSRRNQKNEDRKKVNQNFSLDSFFIRK